MSSPTLKFKSLLFLAFAAAVLAFLFVLDTVNSGASVVKADEGYVAVDIDYIYLKNG